MLLLSNSKILSCYKLNVDKSNFIVSERLENIVGKGGNAGDQHFLLFPQCFQKAFNLQWIILMTVHAKTLNPLFTAWLIIILNMLP